MALNPLQIKKLECKSGRKFTAYHDAHGLYLYVFSNGGRFWRFKYRFHGKNQLLSLGRFPDKSLADARNDTQEYLKLLKSGSNPADVRKALKNAEKHTFEAVAREWWAVSTKNQVEGHRKRVLDSLEKEVFPWIGSTPIQEIRAADLTEIGKRIGKRGALDTARRVVGVRYSCLFLCRGSKKTPISLHTNKIWSR